MVKVSWKNALLALVAALLLAACGVGGLGGQADQATPTVETTSGGTSPAYQQWDSPPPMTIDTTKVYHATLKTEKGDVVVELFADKAPKTVNNFVFLAEQGFYDDTTFHRVIPDFMAQGGDPSGTGSGGPGYTFGDEIAHGLTFDREGMLAMANAGPNTNGSQFFITYGPTPWLNGFHTIFGQVIEGMDVVRALTPRDPQTGPDFTGDRLITVEIATIEESALPTPTADVNVSRPVPEEGRPLADLPVEARAGLFSAPPETIIEYTKDYRASIVTTKGTIVVHLDLVAAPDAVNNFIVLADLGYWDGFPINQVQGGAFVLTGSPAGQPTSDIGYTLPSENKNPAVRGAIGYWFRQDLLASSASQFFIALDDIPGMEEFFTFFGTVESGMQVAEALTTDDSIIRITIETR